jgi:DNA-binding transcriptional ArsR family regulator
MSIWVYNVWMARAATTSDVFNAVAERQRRNILDLLRRGEHSVLSVADELALSQPSVSRHLRVLREVGLVQVRHAGTQRHYRLEPSGLQPIRAWVGGFEEFWNDSFDQLDEYVKRLATDDDDSSQ